MFDHVVGWPVMPGWLGPFGLDGPVGWTHLVCLAHVFGPCRPCLLYHPIWPDWFGPFGLIGMALMTLLGHE